MSEATFPRPPYIDPQTGRFTVPHGTKWPWMEQPGGGWAPEPPYSLGDSVPCESNEFHRHIKATAAVVRNQWASDLCKQCGDDEEAHLQAMADNK